MNQLDIFNAPSVEQEPEVEPGKLIVYAIWRQVKDKPGVWQYTGTQTMSVGKLAPNEKALPLGETPNKNAIAFHESRVAMFSRLADIYAAKAQGVYLPEVFAREAERNRVQAEQAAAKVEELKGNVSTDF
ncbi:MAG TPA: hypothetical protein V6C46_08100 [Coleofasciculaceae cyanobacterium]